MENIHLNELKLKFYFIMKTFYKLKNNKNVDQDKNN
jgi:hypothetical protein